MNRLDADTTCAEEPPAPSDLVLAVENSIAQGSKCCIHVRDLYIATGIEPRRVWIGRWSTGEGGDFREDAFYAVLQKFFADNF